MNEMCTQGYYKYLPIFQYLQFILDLYLLQEIKAYNLELDKNSICVPSFAMEFDS